MTDFDADPFGLIGQVLDGQFRVDAMIGEGGFSAVYKGHHLGLDEPVALKCMKIETSLGNAVIESFIKRFRDESRLLYRLSQGNLDIVRSVASGTAIAPATGAMVPYMVLEWLEGRSLAADFHVRREQGGKGRPLFDALALFDPAADALAYAHSQGVIHRDLNPGNLFLAQTRVGIRMKVLDFGVAKVIRDEVLALGPRAQTLANVRIFSPAYAAPEQYDERIGAVSCATDVWSLATILCEAISDRQVFDGDSLGEFFQKVLDPSYPRTPRQRQVVIGDATEKVFAKALAMSPLARYSDVGVFWPELRLALSKDVGGSTSRGSSNPFQPAVMGTEDTQNARLEDKGFDRAKLAPASAPQMDPAKASAAKAAFTELKGTVRMAPPPQSIHHTPAPIPQVALQQPPTPLIALQQPETPLMAATLPMTIKSPASSGQLPRVMVSSQTAGTAATVPIVPPAGVAAIAPSAGISGPVPAAVAVPTAPVKESNLANIVLVALVVLLILTITVGMVMKSQASKVPVPGPVPGASVR